MIIGLLTMVGISACGYKSDLYLPGDPVKVEQLTLPAIEVLKIETRDSLLNENKEKIDSILQSPESDGVEVEILPLDAEQAISGKKNTQ